MLNYIWLGLVLAAVVMGGCGGQMKAITDGAFEAAKAAVMNIALPLAGYMALWLGIMRLAEKSEFVRVLAALIRPVMRRLFPDVPPDHPAMGAMLMNMAANMLGLGNAATPLGLRAMAHLETLTYTGTASTLLAGVSYPNGQSTAYSYYGNSGDLRLQTIWNKGTTSGTGETLSKFDYEYDAEGNITKWTQEGYTAAPAYFDFAYDPANELLGGIKKQVSDNAVLQSHGYAYDKGGNRLSEQIDGTLTTDAHNALNQIVTRTGGSGPLPIRGTTDEPVREVKINSRAATVSSGTVFAGKADVTSGTNTVTVEATDGAGNKRTSQYQVVVSGSGSATLTYDQNANLTNDGAGKTYEWTPLDQLAAVNQGTHRTEFTYDGLGRRVRIVEKDNGSVTATRNFVWVGMQIAEERDGSNAVVKRFYAQGMRQVSGTADSYYYTRDHLNSIREMTDASRAVVARYDYDPYGQRTKTTGSMDADCGYTGHFTDTASGLTLAPYRAYDADLGRWLSRDPIGERGGVNLYGYVGNNPTNEIDPLGLFLGLGVFYAPPISECPAIEGFYRHCVNTCKLTRLIGPIGAVPVALTYGGDWTSDTQNSRSDRAADWDGAVNAFRLWRSCINSCAVDLAAMHKAQCCQVPGMEARDKTDKCCH